jgi:hypothetical protein
MPLAAAAAADAAVLRVRTVDVRQQDYVHTANNAKSSAQQTKQQLD